MNETTMSLAAHDGGPLYPGAVVTDASLTHSEKRALLASWASDARAVPDAPALRRLDNGLTVCVDEILAALAALDGDLAYRRGPAVQSIAARLRTRQGPPRRPWPGDDDDDPPPCPAMIARPQNGPRRGGEAIALEAALAA